MTQIFLLDIAPDPVSTGIGFTGLILVGIVVLVLVAAMLTGFIFLIQRLRKTAGARTHLVVGDSCLNLGSVGSRSNRVTSRPIGPIVQPENSPNQP
jgi:hypothetical protein